MQPNIAIQGKLVEQRPEEGTAEELFAQIQKEKQKLIAEKKIKKENESMSYIKDTFYQHNKALINCLAVYYHNFSCKCKE